jgi:type II secretory pathway predicted ATPase ExeA
VTPEQFFESGAHEEALARLQYVVDQQHRVGLLLGDLGSGKSSLLRVLCRSLQEEGRQAVLVNLTGLRADQFPPQLAQLLRGGEACPGNPAAAWRSILDQIIANRYQQRDTVVLLDDGDQAEPGVLTQVVRLAECDDDPDTRLTVVVAADVKHAKRLGGRLLDLTELRIEIEPWGCEQTRAFVQGALERAGVTGAVFQPEAVDRLHELADGRPRRICQLAELALVAGAGELKDEIDSPTVDAAFEELAVFSS